VDDSCTAVGRSGPAASGADSGSPGRRSRIGPVPRLRFRETVSDTARDHTVLLSTHLTEDVSALCARVIVIDHGTCGSPATATS
jgi:hypothetical protein